MPRDRSRSRDRDRHRRSRSRDRHRKSRSRSRDRDRRRRSRSRDRDRSSRHDAPSTAEQVQALQVAQLQQQQLQKQLLAQQMMMSQSMGGGIAATKKQREVYVGNLTIGIVNDTMLRELFNAALAHFVPDPVTNPPVVGVTMDPSGRFGFVEMRTEELATEAMKLDKVDLCGRHVNVGRPKGYIEPPVGAGSHASALNMAQQFAQTLNTQPTPYLYMENLLQVGSLRKEAEREELKQDVLEESQNIGPVEKVLVPKPPRMISDDDAGRAVVYFGTTEASEKAKDMMDGRTFDGNRVSAFYITEEVYKRIEKGEWVDKAVLTAPPANNQVLPLNPAVPSIPSFGLGGLPSAIPTAGIASIAGFGFGGLPFGATQGWLKLRGIPFTSTKNDIMEFFRGCGTLTEQNIKIVLGMDGRPTGEAFVEFVGDDANIQGGLAKDRQIMPNSSRYVEIFPSSQEEVQRRALTGVMLV